MALTELQQRRIIFHLDFQRGANDVLKIAFGVDLDLVDATDERIIVGTVATALAADIVTYDNESLCTLESILGRVEQAFAKLDSRTVDNSQFVLAAGKVKLNASEARLRQQFYQDKVRELKKALGYSEGLFASLDTGSPTGAGPRL